MPPEFDRESQVREVLIEAVEVQLAAVKAAINFWSEWVERASAFVTTASSGLETARSSDKASGQILLELVDAGRESMRTLTELPRNAAVQFVRELDEIAAKRRARTAQAAPPRASSSRGGGPRSRPAPRTGAKRRVRAKS